MRSAHHALIQINYSEILSGVLVQLKKLNNDGKLTYSEFFKILEAAIKPRLLASFLQAPIQSPLNSKRLLNFDASKISKPKDEISSLDVLIEENSEEPVSEKNVEKQSDVLSKNLANLTITQSAGTNPKEKQGVGIPPRKASKFGYLQNLYPIEQAKNKVSEIDNSVNDSNLKI